MRWWFSFPLYRCHPSPLSRNNNIGELHHGKQTEKLHKTPLANIQEKLLDPKLRIWEDRNLYLKKERKKEEKNNNRVTN